jgi:hypothetical protein
MKEANDFLEAAMKLNIRHWPIRECSLCGYLLGYMFFYEESEVVYDNGCECVPYHNLRASSWDEVARMYNINSDKPEIIKKYNDWWGF